MNDLLKFLNSPLGQALEASVAALLIQLFHGQMQAAAASIPPSASARLVPVTATPES